MWRRLLLLGAVWALTACDVLSPEPTPTQTLPTSTATLTLVPTFTATDPPTAIPTATPTVIPSPETADAAGQETIVPLITTDITAPITLELPTGWQTLTDSSSLPLPEESGFSMVPFAAYRGPVTGGTGYITLFWGFSNVVPAIPVEGGGVSINLWADGLRLLLFALLEPDCNVGRDPEPTVYRVGDGDAIGSGFWAVDCGDSSLDDDILPSPDVQGWFAGFQEDGLNFMFYAYVEPREAIVSAQAELQAILDTVRVDTSTLDPFKVTPER
jgi:hypothetical protein